MRKLKIILITLLIIIGGGALLLTSLYVFTPVVDNAVLGLVNRFSGDDWKIEFGELSGNLFGTVRLDDVRAIHHADTINSRRIELDYSLLDVLKQEYNVQRLSIAGPAVKWHLPPDTSTAPAQPLDSVLAGILPEAFPKISLKRLEISDGSVELVRDTTTENITNINTMLSVELRPDKIYLAPEQLTANWENRNWQLDALTFTADGSWDSLKIADLTIDFAGIALRGSGSVMLRPPLRWTFQFDSLNGNLEKLGKLGVEVPYEKGRFDVNGNLQGTAESVSGSVALSGSLDSLQVRRFSADIGFQPDDGLRLQNVQLDANFAQLNGDFHIGTNENNAVNARFSGLDLQKMNVTDVPGKLNGNINFRFAGTDAARISGSGKARLYKLAYDDMRLDTLALSLSANNGNWKFEKPSRIVVSEGAVFNMAGTLSRDQILDVSLTTERNSLDSLAKRLAIENIGGAGSMELRLTGKMTDPSLDGYIYLDSLTYDKTVVYGISGDTKIADLASKRQGFFDLELATGYIGDVFLTSGLAQFQFDGNRITFDPFQFYSEENSIESAGEFTFSDSLLTLSLSHFQLDYEKYNIRNDTPLNVRLYGGDSLIIEPLKLVAAESGEISAEGTLLLSEGGNSNLQLQLQNIRLAPFNEYIFWDHELSGFVDTDVELYGALDNPEVDINVNFNELAIDSTQIGRAYGDFSIADKRLSINVISFEGQNDSYMDVNGNVEFELAESDSGQEVAVARDIPLGFNVVFGNFQIEDYNFLLQSTVPVAGAITGRLDIGGSWQKPQATLSLEGKSVKSGDYEFPALVVDAEMQPDNLVINSADINFLNSEIKVRGEKALSWNPDQPDSIFSDKYLELFVEIKEDSLNFLNAINPELERLVGDITANAHLKGDYDNPQFEALAFSVKDGRFYLSKVENSIDDINTSGHLEGTRLVIDDFTARSPKPKRRGNFLQRWFQSVKSLFYEEPVRGDIRGSGWVDLADVTRPRVNLSMNIDDAYFNYFLENTQVVIDTRNLTVTGRDTILVAGDITIVEGDVEFDFVESEKNLLFETNVREEPPFVIYNLNIEIPSNFNVRSYETLNSFDMAIDGELRVISQPRSELEMSGSLNTSGVYFVQGEEFKIEDGKIEFVNPKELPELNLTARTFKKDQIRDQQLTFLLNVHGKIDSPEKEIVIQDEQGNVLNYEVKDQLALLLFGMTFDQLGGSDAQDILLSRGEQVLTQALVSSIEREARTFTGLDQIRLDQQDSFFSSKLNQPSTLSLGKYLTPNLYLEYRSRLASTGLGNVPAPQLSWEAGNQIYLQYRLNRSWSFSTIYQKTLEGNNKVQFDINWQTGF